MRRRSLLALAVAIVMLPLAAGAQSPPLKATIFFKNAPADLTFDSTGPATPVTIVVQVENTSGAAIFTTEDFPAAVKEVWRLLYFTREDGGIVTNTAAAQFHDYARVGFCFSRQGVLQAPTAIPVAPIAVLSGPPQAFSIELTVDDARKYFDLTQPGRHTVQLAFHVLTYQFGDAVIQDCDQFPDTALANVGDAVSLGRQEFQVVSNALELFIRGSDTTPPATTVLQSPAPNAAGWNNQDVTLDFTASDNAGGSGVNRIEVTLAGAQSGVQVLPGPSGAVGITAEGVTDVAFHAVDNQDNPETAQGLTVRIDRTPPVVTPPANVTVVATEAGGARGSAAPALAAFLGGGSATDNLDPSPARMAPAFGGVAATSSTLFPLGTDTVTFRFQDIAGNVGSADGRLTVVPGKPAISVAVAGKGIAGGVRWYDLRFTNTGTGIARNPTVSQLLFRTLSGTGAVTYNATLSPALPAALGDLAIGASATIRVFLNVPPTVTRFSISESGQFQDVAGTLSSFAVSQAVFP